MTLRTFFLLGILAAVGVALAAFSVASRPGDFRFADAGTPVFEGLAERLPEVTGFELETKAQGKLMFAKVDGGWTVADRGGFPAKGDLITKSLVTISELTYVAPKTARAENFDKLELGEPADDGEGTRLRLLDGSGEEMAHLVVGNSFAGLEGLSEGGVYIRLPEGQRAWLAKGLLEPGPEIRDWIERKIFGDMRVMRIKSAAVGHPDGHLVSVFKDQAEDAHYILNGVPGNMTIKSPFTVDSVAGAIGDFLMEDMIPRAEKPIDKEQAIHVRFETWNGLVLTIAMQRKSEKDIWMVADVDGSGAVDDAARAEAAELAARLSRWAFQISDFRYETIGKRMEDLLDPVENNPS